MKDTIIHRCSGACTGVEPDAQGQHDLTTARAQALFDRDDVVDLAKVVPKDIAARFANYVVAETRAGLGEDAAISP